MLGVKRYVPILPLETVAQNLVIGPRIGLAEPVDWFEFDVEKENDHFYVQAELLMPSM